MLTIPVVTENQLKSGTCYCYVAVLDKNYHNVKIKFLSHSSIEDVLLFMVIIEIAISSYI